MSKSKYFVGMHKQGHHASACLVTYSPEDRRVSTELFLKERQSRVKYDGGSIQRPLRAIAEKVELARARFCENSAILRPIDYEERWQAQAPYFEQLNRLKLDTTTGKLNPAVQFLSHHRAHAYAALALSPFEDSLILVFDGAGNFAQAFDAGDPEADCGLAGQTECCTVYRQQGPRLELLYKQWQTLHINENGELEDEAVQGRDFGLGALYGIVARHVFNDERECGKVMGLAPFGQPALAGLTCEGFLRGLDAKTRFRGKGKSEWEAKADFKFHADLCASAQTIFEASLLEFIRSLRNSYPWAKNLILTGGCALNCVANQKIFNSGLFERVFVTPFPGDESISIGAASYLLYTENPTAWQPRPMQDQIANFGPLASVPSDDHAVLERVFPADFFELTVPADIAKHCAAKIALGQIIGWFQGQSESGPRSLGNRSLLANPAKPGTKDRLNNLIKKRESFRPYAPSCLYEKVTEYFEVDASFESPFMSFSPKVRPTFRASLKEAMHIDGSARVQTVRRSQNSLFYSLLEAVGEATGLSCVLNTSLNIMGQPILETIEDAAEFLRTVPVDGLAVGRFFITRR